MQSAAKYIGGIGLLVCLVLVLGKYQGGDNVNPFVPTEKIIKTDGMAVLIVEETSARSRLTPEQLAIFTDTTWRNYVTEKDGQYRVLDQHTEFTDPDDPFAAAMQRKRTTLPWLIVSTAKGSEELPLPASVTELMDVLRKWGEK